MMKRWWVSVFVCVIPTAVLADEASTVWYEKVTVGGELRMREETQLNFQPIVGGVDDSSVVFLRVRLSADARPVEGLRVFIQPQFSRAFAQEESTVAGNGDAADPNNVFDLHQGFFAWEKIGGSPVTLQIGRQELVYGEERLIGNFNWSNVGRSFDAGKVRLAWERFWIDGFFAWTERNNSNEYFSGLYSSTKISSDMTFDAYTLLLWDTGGDGVPGVTGTRIVTIGDRLAGTCWEERIDHSFEAAVQLGQTRPNTHLAYAAHAASGYNFDVSWKPRVGLEYNLASGDDPGTSRVERFHNLFPTNHNKYGYIDFVSWRNIHDVSPSVRVKPSASTMVELAYHLFFLPESADGLFRASGAQLRAGAAGASRLAGHEVDLLAKYQWKKWLDVLASYSLFRGGKFFDDTGTNGTAHLAYLQAQASF